MGQVEELFRIVHRQHAQEHRIHHAEDSSVGANAQRQRGNDRNGKAGRISDLPDCVAIILKHRDSPMTYIERCNPFTTSGGIQLNQLQATRDHRSMRNHVMPVRNR